MKTPYAKSQLLKMAADSEGFESVQAMLERATFDGSCPGVCVKCGYVDSEIEPDAVYDCPKCERTDALRSVLIVAGLI